MGLIIPNELKTISISARRESWGLYRRRRNRLISRPESDNDALSRFLPVAPFVDELLDVRRCTNVSNFQAGNARAETRTGLDMDMDNSGRFCHVTSCARVTTAQTSFPRGPSLTPGKYSPTHTWTIDEREVFLGGCCRSDTFTLFYGLARKSCIVHAAFAGNALFSWCTGLGASCRGVENEILP